MLRKIFSNFWIIILLLAIAIPLIVPFLHSGYFPTHDGEWAVVRLGDMFREIRDHQFPPRYSENLNFGYGYPLFNFAYPLPYYIGLLVHVLRFSFIDSIKIVFAGSVVFSIIFMFFAAKEFWGSKWSGFVSALLFAYFPYRIVDLYARGSIGETVAFVFFPLIFYFALKLYKYPKKNIYIGFLSLAIAGLLLSHNIMAVLFFPLFLLFITMLIGKNFSKYLMVYISAIVYGCMTAAFFWLPALAEKQLILISKIPIADRSINFVSLGQLLFSPFGYGIPEAKSGGFTYQIGWPQLVSFFVIAIFVINSIFRKKQLFDRQQKIAGGFLVAIVVMVCMMFPFTNILWKITPLLKEINYPWTFLGPIGFLGSFLAGYLGMQKNKVVNIFGIVLGISAIFFYLPFAHPQLFTYHDNSYYLTNDATTTSSSEYTPLWVKKLPDHRPTEKVQIAPGSGTISSLFSNSKKISFQVTMGQYGGPVRINTIYYPGWNITVDGKLVGINDNNTYGVMDISLPSGAHNVVATFSETPLRFISDVLSFIGALITLILLGNAFVKKRNSI